MLWNALTEVGIANPENVKSGGKACRIHLFDIGETDVESIDIFRMQDRLISQTHVTSKDESVL